LILSLFLSKTIIVRIDFVSVSENEYRKTRFDNYFSWHSLTFQRFLTIKYEKG
jgi:hypothetical protein